MSCAIGLGCRKGIPAAQIVAAVEAALAQAKTDCAKAESALYTIDEKHDEAGLQEAARVMGLPLRFLPREALMAYNGRGATCSLQSQARFGLDSVAEASALAGAGDGARLIVPRMSQNGVTCAIAKGEVK